MQRFITAISILFIIILFAGASCNKGGGENPNIPRVNINVTIDPNSTLFLELNTVGGWMYLDETPGILIPPPSRGVIVYRMDVDQFKAYERQPPNTPFQCCDDNTCTKLLLGKYYPLVKDTCTNTSYSILDGSIVEGEGQYSLIQYNAYYDGSLLHVYN